MSKLHRLYVRLFAGFCLSLWVVSGLANAPARPVIVATVEQRDVDQTIEALGTLKANETAQVSATMTETIAAIHFNDAQRVEKGELLVELSDREQQALLEESLAELDNATRQLERTRRLLDNRHVSQSDLDTRLREYDAAVARVKVIESQLAERQIRAPFAGITGLRQVSVGALVTPGMPLFTLHDDSVMKLDFSVPETRMASLAPGQHLVATAAAFPGREFTGEVRSIDNQVDPVTRSVVVRAVISNEERLLKPGMLMTLRVTVAKRQALVVPEEAVLLVARDAFVMVLEEQGESPVARQQAVNLGRRHPGAVEVLSGLAAGERIIVHGATQIKAGQVVRILGQTRIGESVAAILSGS